MDDLEVAMVRSDWLTWGILGLDRIGNMSIDLDGEFRG